MNPGSKQPDRDETLGAVSRAGAGRSGPLRDGAVPADIVHVAAAIILREDGRFLLAQRPPGKVYAGYWEFPGGKIERGEGAQDALRRELHEELGIDVIRAYPWITRRYAYAHATVDLHFFRVPSFHGIPLAREGQQLSWQCAEQPTVAPMLPANAPVLKALTLPSIYAITNASELGIEVFRERLEQRLREGKVRLIQVREPDLPAMQLERLTGEVLAQARKFGARVLVNADIRAAERCGADGVHLKAAQLQTLGARPGLALVGASCHDAHDLERAARLDVDFVVLGPVAPTPSHPDAQGMGWRRFTELIACYPFPVYALGGMRPDDLERAWRCGAHGLGMQRAVW